MLNYILPLAIVILANTVYQICTKSAPENLNPFASLTVTYLIGAVLSAILYYILGGGESIFTELKKLNWSPILLGFVIVALEGGWIYIYKAGWQVSTAQIIQSAVLGILLIFVGTIFYKEPLSWNKIVGICICLVGLVFINIKQ